MRWTIGIVAILTLASFGYGQEGKSPPVKVTIALNWKPEPEFGGIYAAREMGIFARHGLDVQIQPVGDKAKTMVISGQAQFGLAAADELISSRAQGADLKAIFATYQVNPQGVMAHPERQFKDIGQLLASAGTFAYEPGLHYWDFFKQKYGDIKVKPVPYDYNVAKFMIDPNYSQQCFVTSEPLEVEQKGTKPQVFLIADSGYNPYAGLVIVSGDYLNKNRATAVAMAAALREGWQAYLADPTLTNRAMAKLNRSMDLKTFAAAAEAQKILVQPVGPAAPIVGAMSEDRWTELGRQLVSLKVVKKAPPASECFVDLFPAKP